jgi:2,4-dienoyl-CoA reductase-like NADH-dependent reductase (Old Yellow Enzyme family)
MVTLFPEWADRPTATHIEFYRRRAASGVGLVIVGATFVTPEGRGFANQMGIDNDSKISAFRALSAAMPPHAPTILQLFHAGPKTSRWVSGQAVVAPPGWPTLKPRYDRPRELRLDDDERIEATFVAAAERASQAGLAGVELHGANGYLLHALNDFAWKQCRGATQPVNILPLRIVRRIRQRLVRDFIVGFTISPYPALSEELKHGAMNYQERFVQLARWLIDAGVDYLHVYRCKADERNDAALPVYSSVLRDAGIHTPIIEGASVRSPIDAARFLNHGATLVAVGRTLLLNPDFPGRAEHAITKDEMYRLSTSSGLEAFFCEEQARIREKIQQQLGR